MARGRSRDQANVRRPHTKRRKTSRLWTSAVLRRFYLHRLCSSATARKQPHCVVWTKREQTLSSCTCKLECSFKIHASSA